MSDKNQEPDEPTQRTLKGTEIPVPSRKSIFDALTKVSKPDDQPKK